MDLYFDTSFFGPYGLLLALYNSQQSFVSQAVISVSFSQSSSTSSSNVYVILGVLLGSGALCVSCCLVCIRYMCLRKRVRRGMARVHVYHDWSIAGSQEQDKALFDSSKAQIDPANPQECTICLDVMAEEQRVTKLPCGHLFHSKCINMWFEKQNFCCNCKTVFDISRSFD